MKDEKETQTPARSHQKSPNYPANSLAEAIKVARKIFDSDKRTVLSYESAAKAGGYGSLNGRSRTKLSSLRKYGLLDAVGDGLQISQLALRILHQPETTPDYTLAIKEAALRPEIFRSFYESHRDASEQAIQSELIIKGGFSPEGAKLFAKAFRDTIVFAKLDEKEYIPPDAEDKNENGKGGWGGTTPPKLPLKPAVTPPSQVLAEWSFPVGQNEATIRFTGSGHLVGEDFGALKDYIDLFQKQYERKLKSEQDQNLDTNINALFPGAIK